MRRIRRMQERAALQPDIDERGLHTWHHALDATAIDVADVAAAPAALDVHFLQHAVLDHADTRLAGRDVDQDFLGHRGHSSGLSGKQSSMEWIARTFMCVPLARAAKPLLAPTHLISGCLYTCRCTKPVRSAPVAPPRQSAQQAHRLEQ